MIYWNIAILVVLMAGFALLYWHQGKAHASYHAAFDKVVTSFEGEKKRATTEHAVRAQVCCECKKIVRKYDEIEGGKVICHQCKRNAFDAIS